MQNEGRAVRACVRIHGGRYVGWAETADGEQVSEVIRFGLLNEGESLAHVAGRLRDRFGVTEVDGA